MIASFSSPSKLEGVAAAGGRGRVATEFHVGANHYSPLQSRRIPPPIGTVGANHHSPWRIVATEWRRNIAVGASPRNAAGMQTKPRSGGGHTPPSACGGHPL